MGQEIANGFSELNDAEDQAERFRQQVAARDAGDEEAMHYDQDYVTALEYGMPPTAGEGVGIDRLVMCSPTHPLFGMWCCSRICDLKPTSAWRSRSSTAG